MSTTDSTFDQEFHVERIKAALGRSRPVYTLTTYSGSNSQTDHVRIFGVKDGTIIEVTVHVALLLDRKVMPGKGIAYRGGGYSKGLDAADDACRAIGRKLDQSTWFEL